MTKAQNTKTEVHNAHSHAYRLVDNNAELHSGVHAYDVKDVNGRTHLSLYADDLLSTHMDAICDLNGFALNSITTTVSSNKYDIKVLLVEEQEDDR